MACQQGLTFRSTAQMATSEARGRAATHRARQPPAHPSPLSTSPRRSGAMVQPQVFLCPTTMCSEDAPLTCTGWVLPFQCSHAWTLQQLCVHPVMPKLFKKQLSWAPRQEQDTRTEIRQGAQYRCGGDGAGGGQGRLGQLGGHAYPSQQPASPPGARGSQSSLPPSPHRYMI